MNMSKILVRKLMSCVEYSFTCYILYSYLYLELCMDRDINDVPNSCIDFFRAVQNLTLKLIELSIFIIFNSMEAPFFHEANI